MIVFQQKTREHNRPGEFPIGYSTKNVCGELDLELA